MIISCAVSLSLLSDYHDGSLGEFESLQVREHLDSCLPCLQVFSDLTLIVLTAAELKTGAVINFPDEEMLWDRLKVSTGTFH